jgi:hypothetical protein
LSTRRTTSPNQGFAAFSPNFFPLTFDACLNSNLVFADGLAADSLGFTDTPSCLGEIYQAAGSSFGDLACP